MKSFFILLAFLAALGAVAYLLADGEYNDPGPLAQAADLEFQHGARMNGIAQQLTGAGVIRYPFVFEIAAKATHQDTKLKAGEYLFPPHVALKEVIGMMARGDVLKRSVTIAEGLTSWQAMEILGRENALAGPAPQPPPAEGALLPQTYSYMRGDTRAALAEKMQGAMTKTLADLWAARDPSIPLQKPMEAVTLASIVEKESGRVDERTRIAGLFENRLRRNMKLQSDPTVIYALTNGRIQENGQGPLGRRLLTADLATDSPYNTYRYPGLPPGPICNPGRDALYAVLHPAVTDALFFVADGTGGHVFAATLAEHQKNVDRWHAVRRASGQ